MAKRKCSENVNRGMYVQDVLQHKNTSGYVYAGWEKRFKNGFLWSNQKGLGETVHLEDT